MIIYFCMSYAYIIGISLKKQIFFKTMKATENGFSALSSVRCSDIQIINIYIDLSGNSWMLR